MKPHLFITCNNVKTLQYIFAQTNITTVNMCNVAYIKHSSSTGILVYSKGAICGQGCGLAQVNVKSVQHAFSHSGYEAVTTTVHVTHDCTAQMAQVNQSQVPRLAV